MKSWFGQTKYMFSSKILAWEYFVYFKIRTTQIVVCNILFFSFEKWKWSSISSSLIQAMFHCKSLKKSENSGQWLYMTSKSTLYLFFSVYLLELSRVFFFLFVFKDLAYLGLPVFFLLTLLFTFKERNILKSMWIFFFFSCDFSGISELV